MTKLTNYRTEAFRAWTKANGGVTTVAERSGVPETTLYSYLSGKSKSLKGVTQDKIAAAFNIQSDALFGGKAATVPVVGYVQAGAEAVFFAAGQGPFDYVKAPDGYTEDTVAVEIRGESLGPFFTDWLVFYDDVQSPITEDLIGRLCVLGLPDGRVLIKLVKASREVGLYHLLSQTEAPIMDQPVQWGARVRSMTPK